MGNPHAEIAQGRLTGIYGLPAPEGWPALSVDNPVDLEIHAARQEIANLPDTKFPSMASVAANHPGVLGYQVMSDPEYQNAVRYDNLMRRLESIQRGTGMQFRDSPAAGAYTGGTYRPEPMRDRSFWGEYWGSKPHSGTEQLPPYRHRGVLATGQPLRNMFDLWMVPFSAIANTAVRPMYDLGKAAAEAPEVANKAFGGVPRAIMAVADPNYQGEPNAQWANERKLAENVPFDDPLMVGTQGDPAAFYRSIPSKMPTGTVEGAQILEEVGYPEHWSRNLMGMAIETPFDFASGYAKMAKNIGRVGRYASPAARVAAARHAAGGLAGEMAPVAGMTALLEALQRAQEKR